MAKTNLLRLLALQARQRIKEGCNIQGVYGKHLNIISNKEDEALYAKVCEILKENRDVFNPLAKIMDKELYNSLEGTAKEKYIFDLVDKYGELKNRFLREHSKEQSMVV